jgi:hypothetical protein
VRVELIVHVLKHREEPHWFIADPVSERTGGAKRVLCGRARIKIDPCLVADFRKVSDNLVARYAVRLVPHGLEKPAERGGGGHLGVVNPECRRAGSRFTKDVIVIGHALKVTGFQQFSIGIAQEAFQAPGWEPRDAPLIKYDFAIDRSRAAHARAGTKRAFEFDPEQGCQSCTSVSTVGH